MSRWRVGIAIAVAVLSISALGRTQERRDGDWGRGPGRGPGHDMGFRMLAMLESDRFKAELNLTDQQAARLHQIVLEGEKATVKARADLRVQGLELRELLRADQPEREAVMKKVQEISEVRGQMMRQHVESLLAAKSVLTPEQQQKFRSLRAGRARRGGRMGNRGPGFGRGSGPSQPAEPPAPPSQ